MLRLERIRVANAGFELSIDLEVNSGETLALLGPSGSGKTTVLRVIAGLAAPDAGRVWIGERDVTRLPSERRGIGFLFQDYALFPHLSVYDNVAFGLVERHWAKAEIEARVTALLEKTGLTAHRNKKPAQLSGGEQQRVALARALAPRPPILLLDEPLGALDLRLREHLLLTLKRILKEERTTALYVTHDQSEAFVLADRVAIMRNGRIVQLGTPGQVFQKPSNVWCARFLGHKNVLAPDEARRLGLRERHWLLPPTAIALGGSEKAEVLEALFLGPRIGLWLNVRGVRLYWEGPLDPLPEEGKSLGLRIDLDRAVPLEP